MKITPIWDAIETLLKTDSRTKDAIKQYEKGKMEPEGWSHVTPLCVIGRRAEVPLGNVFLGDATGSRPRVENGTTFITILGRVARIATDKYYEDLKEIDTIQDNVFSVLNENSKLGGSVHKSRVERMYPIQLADYSGFELVVTFGKMEG
jgi:hypothetical protein